jgi:hypothetical protein
MHASFNNLAMFGHFEEPRLSAAGSNCFAQWKVDSANWRSKLNITPDFAPWTSQCSFENMPALPPRVLDLMDCAAMHQLNLCKLTFSSANMQNSLKGILLDTSQSHERKTMTNVNGIAPCLTTSSTLYSFDRKGMVLGFEHMLLQGHRSDIQVPETMTDHDLRVLAGEGIALPCLGTIVWAMLITKAMP